MEFDHYDQFCHRNNENRITVQNVTQSYVTALSNGFSTCDLDELEDHIKVEHHSRHLYPDNFWSARAFDMSLKLAANETLFQFRRLQSYSGRLKEIYAAYEIAPPSGPLPRRAKLKTNRLLVPEYRTLRSFQMFIKNIERFRSQQSKLVTQKLFSNLNNL